jgi:hypothetical protein
MYFPFVNTVKKIINSDIINKDIINTEYNFNEINENDTLIWIGVNPPDFNLLNTRGIYTIWFNTEPDTNQYNSNEIWTYSKYLFNSYEKSNPHQIIKFIPIICEDNVPSISYNLKIDDTIKLVFIGNLNYRPDKKNRLY